MWSSADRALVGDFGAGFVAQPRRWVAEKSLGRFGRWRRLFNDHEAPPEVTEVIVTLAAIRLMLHPSSIPIVADRAPHDFATGLSLVQSVPPQSWQSRR
jgi:hypothetical protein